MGARFEQTEGRRGWPDRRAAGGQRLRAQEATGFEFEDGAHPLDCPCNLCNTALIRPTRAGAGGATVIRPATI